MNKKETKKKTNMAKNVGLIVLVSTALLLAFYYLFFQTKDEPVTKGLSKELFELTLENSDLYPDFESVSLAEYHYEKVTMDSIKGKNVKTNKVENFLPKNSGLTVIEFVSTSCTFCQEAQKTYTELVKKHNGNKNIQFVQMFSEPLTAVAEFNKLYGNPNQFDNSNQYYDLPQDTMFKQKIQYTPTYLIYQNGTFAYANIGNIQSLDMYIDNYLKASK